MTAMAQLGRPPPPRPFEGSDSPDWRAALAREEDEAEETEATEAEDWDERAADAEEADAWEESEEREATRVAGAAVSDRWTAGVSLWTRNRSEARLTNGRESALVHLASRQCGVRVDHHEEVRPGFVSAAVPAGLIHGPPVVVRSDANRPS